MLAKILGRAWDDPRVSAGLLFLRALSGFAFMLHGWRKINNPLAWMGPDSGVPGFLQALAALSEFGGGLGWILGLLTPLCSAGLLCTMFTAAARHILRGDAFVGRAPSWELAAVYFAVALLLLLSGPGRYSADWLLFGRRKNGASQ
jgi:putative oxidoreductase